MAEEAESKVVVVKAIASTKDSKDHEPKKTEQVEKETQTSEAEVTDELCTNSEYGSRTPEEPAVPGDSRESPKSVEVTTHQKPPPRRDRTKRIGGKDYYTLTYYDPSDDD